MLGEIADKGLHRRMPKSIEPEEIHFFQGFFRRPFLESHAVSGDKHAGAVIAEAAVHKYFLLRIVAEKREKLRDLIVGWRRPATDSDVHKAYAERFGLPAFPGNFPGVFAAKIDDSRDPQFLQFRKAFLMRLRAAIQKIADLARVRNSTKLQFLPECRSFRWRSRRTCIRLREQRRRKSAAEQ